jgi:nucleoside-diphosphate-sugar epimerase
VRVVVVGGTRFIGPAIVAALQARHHEVTIVHRGRSPSPVPVDQWLADRTDVDGLRAAFEALEPDVIVHTCAMTREHAEAFVQAAPLVPVVLLSSQDV